MELPGKRELREQILHQMDGRTSYVSDKDVYREIDKAILRSSHGGYGTLSEKEELRRQMFYSIRGFDVLEKYLGDSSISEIMVIGASRIFVEQNGKIRRIEEHFSEEGDVYRLIEQIVAPTNRMVNEACLKITGNAAIQDIVHSSKYAACEKCIHKGSSLSAIFVTAYGDCYHSTLGCSGLKRTIKAVRLKDVGRLRPCSRCASGR